MLLIILCLLSFGSACFCYWKYKKDSPYSMWDFWACISTGIGCMFLVIFFVLLLNSYDEAIDMEAYYKYGYSQEKNALEKYRLLSLSSDFQKGFTDLKYQEYQSNIQSMIAKLRDKITLYNKNLNSRLRYDDNILFSWFIIVPKDVHFITDTNW